ncbi:hypothetical protein [Rugosimonospora africana]|uniref:Uncharacterized protein n=1 Tax=Rugosimonospora africana TaxID=556532 RepID=A0A8J3QZK8_9ACTN|nr:hypothetical protein [Rugosimonospora africana]GIH18650.1 hypothetical protein Raf01_68220 [Rugosimonospora africana]
MFDLLRGPQATRLVFGGPDLVGPDPADQPRTLYGIDVHTVPVIDGTGTAREIYGLPAGGPTTAVTVRPDGYVAAITPA